MTDLFILVKCSAVFCRTITIALYLHLYWTLPFYGIHSKCYRFLLIVIALSLSLISLFQIVTIHFSNHWLQRYMRPFNRDISTAIVITFHLFFPAKKCRSYFTKWMGVNIQLQTIYLFESICCCFFLAKRLNN